MKKLKLSSISIAWLARAKSAVAPVRAHNAQERLDLVLPRGWPESAGAVAWCWRRGDKRESGQVSDLNQLPVTVRGARACVWTPAADTMLTSATLPGPSLAQHEADCVPRTGKDVESSNHAELGWP